MRKCPNCNHEMEDDLDMCQNCGTNFHATSEVGTPQAVGNNDKPNMGVNIISLCCLPILGIILYFIWKDERPQAAKSVLIFGLIGFGIGIVFFIIAFSLGFFAEVFFGGLDY